MAEAVRVKSNKHRSKTHEKKKKKLENEEIPDVDDLFSRVECKNKDQNSFAALSDQYRGDEATNVETGSAKEMQVAESETSIYTDVETSNENLQEDERLPSSENIKSLRDSSNPSESDEKPKLHSNFESLAIEKSITSTADDESTSFNQMDETGGASKHDELPSTSGYTEQATIPIPKFKVDTEEMDISVSGSGAVSYRKLWEDVNSCLKEQNVDIPKSTVPVASVSDDKIENVDPVKLSLLGEPKLKDDISASVFPDTPNSMLMNFASKPTVKTNILLSAQSHDLFSEENLPSAPCIFHDTVSSMALPLESPRFISIADATPRTTLAFASSEVKTGIEVKMQPSAPTIDTCTSSHDAQHDLWGNATKTSGTSLGPMAALAVKDSCKIKDHREIIHKKIVSSCVPIVEGTLKPFTESQLKSLYYNPELEANHLFIDAFIEDHRAVRNHEFQEILLGYLRARNNLQMSMKEIQTSQVEFQQMKEHLWVLTDHTASAKGQCQDGRVVIGSQKYSKALFNESAATKIDRILKHTREQIHDHFCLYAYASQMGRLQVEAYLHNLILSSPDLKCIPHNSQVQGCHPSQLSLSITAQVENLKRCISILFALQRKPIKDKQFVTDTRTWLSRLIAILLRVATYEDHLFILNHILRCPAGVGEWAAPFVQLPIVPVSKDQFSFGDQSLDHAVTVLATLLLPVKGRDEFLQHVKSVMTSSTTSSPTKNEESLWVLVDSEGEEDEDPSNYWLYWRENDLVALLNQIPLESMFRHVLRIDQRDGSDVYDVHLTTEQSMLKVLAFATELVHILRDGLKTFNLVRYRQLTKRLSRLIRHTVQYVSDHWLNFKTSHKSLDSALLLRLQVEFDQFFRRATRCIFSSQKLGAWQFMAGLPYTCVSTSMLWQIIHMLHSNNVEDKDPDTVNYAEVGADLRDQNIKMQFEESLTSMPECEAYYLLTTFANMACSRDSSARDLIQTIAMEIYEIAFVSSHTREMCSKGGRELLAIVAFKHPFIISHLIHAVKDTMTQVGMVSLYLFRELPFHQWKPLELDMNVIEDWLIGSQLTSPPNLLARLVLANMNWGHTQNDLYLDIQLHRKVAILVVDSYVRLVPSKGGLITESFKQVSNIASLVCQTPTPEQAFCHWAWDLLLQLKLHLFSRPVSQIQDALMHPAESFSVIPNCDCDEMLQTLLNGIREKQAIACYVTLVMTTYGHSIAEFAKNVALLTTLLESHHYRAAIHVLSVVSAMFYTSSNSLTSCDKLVSIVQNLLMCDLTYMKMAKSLVLPEFPGKYLKMFVAMILQSANSAAQLGSSATIVYLTWLECICSLQNWSRDRNALYVIDMICKAAFLEQNTTPFVKDFFLSHYKNQVNATRFQNPVSSFLSWVVTGSSPSPLLLCRQSSIEFPWFTYFALDVEATVEEESQIWKTLAFEMLNNPRSTPDAALKKVSSKMHISTPPVLQLAIYHWAQQALDNFPGHPLTPLFWQRFFGLYLQRWPMELGEPDRGSVGSRFFDSMSNLHLLKRMKKRLHELNDYHLKLAKEYLKLKQQELEMTGVENENVDKTMAMTAKADHNYRLAKLYSTLVLWIEETKLHDGSLYLPSLPPQYDSQRILQLQQNEKSPWLEFINFDDLRVEQEILITEWTNELCRRLSATMNTSITEDSACESIVKRLASYEASKPPPSIVPLKAPIPEVTENIFSDQATALNFVRDHFNILTEYARTFSLQMNQHVALDSEYLDYIPQLYKNVDVDVSVQVPCKQGSSSILRSGDSRCSGPACITLKFKAKKLIENCQIRIEHNRSDWQELINEVLLPPPQSICSAAVFIENLLVMLVKKYQMDKSHQDTVSVQKCVEIGVKLFYFFHQLVTAETTFYSPTRQFLTSSVEILGQEFISGNGEQCETLVNVILKHPQSVGILAPHFTPSAANKNTFIQLYTQMVAINELHSADLAFVLLTKFDISAWMANYRPRLSERQQIFHTIGEVLQSMGLYPDDKLLPISEIYRNHMQTMLLYQFPDHYSDVLQLLFKGSDFHTICADVWNDLLNSLLMESRTFPLNPFNVDTLQIICQRFAQNQIMFTTQQLKETLELMHEHFSQKRQSNKDVAVYGLYSRYQPYSTCIACFLAVISNAFIYSLKEDCKKRSFEYDAEHEVLPVICKAFSPWIQPLHIGGKFLMPWIPGDVQLAQIMISAFTECVRCLHFTTNYHPNLVSAFFEYYNAVCNAQDGSPYILVTCYNQVFKNFDWNHFHLNHKTMQIVMKLLNFGSAECLQFLGSIIIRLQWPIIVETWVQTETPLTLIQNIADVAYMFVKLSFEPNLKNDPSMRTLLKSVEMFPWHLIDPHIYETLTKCFLTNCDCECIFNSEKTLQDSATLRFLKVCAGLVEWPTELHHDSQSKQCAFLHMVVQLLCMWATKNKSSMKAYNDRIIKALVELMQEIEQVVVKNKINSVFEESIPLLTEIFSVLNQASVATLQDICSHAILSWVSANPCSTLIPPCLRTICCNLVSIVHIVNLSEAIITIYFSTDPKECTCLAEGYGWKSIASAVQAPNLTEGEFYSECLKQGAYLTLYASAVNYQQKQNGIEENFNLFNKLVQWSSKVLPSSGKEDKLILLWNKAIEMAIALSLYQQPGNNISATLLSFCEFLLHLGEDKTSAGFLGVIGFGRKSSYSSRFRLCARGVAALIASQINSDGNLQLETIDASLAVVPASPTGNKSAAQSFASNAIIQLQLCKGNKLYSSCEEHIEPIISLIQNCEKGMQSYKTLMSFISNTVYPDKNYLLILQESSEKSEFSNK